MRRYRQQNPKYGDWRWANFQMQVALHSINFPECILEYDLVSCFW